jgi:ParB family chromosome partitioning protein
MPIIPAPAQPITVPDFEHELPSRPLQEELQIPAERTGEMLPVAPVSLGENPSTQQKIVTPEPVLYPSPKPVPQKKFEEPKISESVFNIEVAKVKSNPDQPRRHFDEESIRELASSIREFGILQPIVVTKVLREVPTGTDVEYILIAGERRLLASRLLGLPTIPAIIRNVDLERERLEMAVIENIQRENLSPIEVARAIARLQDEFRLTQREIALRLGKSREAVANTVRMLDLPQSMQEALEQGKITESHGRLLLSVEDPGAQQKLFKDLVDTHMTTRELKSRIEAVKRGEKKDEAPMPLSPELKIFEEKLSSELGAPVSIHQSGDSGKITISFYSGEELQSILDKLGKEQ